MNDWLNTTPSSYWQRGCDDGRAGKPRQWPDLCAPPSAPANDSYRKGYEFGKRTPSDEQIDDAYREAWGDRKVVFNSPIPVEVLRSFARIICRRVVGRVGPTGGGDAS